MSAALPSDAFMSIGEVLATLRPDFPDVTISKIRFLESEGLVEPRRTPSGYRKFSHEDVERLRYVLTAQRDQYLPLRVIKEHLDALDGGLAPAANTRSHSLRTPRAVVAGDEHLAMNPLTREAANVRLSRPELLGAAGISDDQLRQLEEFGLIASRPGGQYDEDALLVARTIGEMMRFGLEPRHLRSFRSSADREVGLIEQLIMPLQRQRTPEARGRAEEMSRELAALCVRLHAALVKAGLRRGLYR